MKYVITEEASNEILSCFRKAHSTQHALFQLLASWRKPLHKGGFLGSILMDFSKSYDCLYDLELAKLQACGFSKESVKFSNKLYTKI